MAGLPCLRCGHPTEAKGNWLVDHMDAYFWFGLVYFLMGLVFFTGQAVGSHFLELRPPRPGADAVARVQDRVRQESMSATLKADVWELLELQESEAHARHKLLLAGIDLLAFPAVFASLVGLHMVFIGLRARRTRPPTPPAPAPRG
jgi:hypothetical protein